MFDPKNFHPEYAYTGVATYTRVRAQETVKKCMKDYKCEACKNTIHKGEPLIRVYYQSGDKYWNRVFHVGC